MEVIAEGPCSWMAWTGPHGRLVMEARDSAATGGARAEHPTGRPRRTTNQVTQRCPKDDTLRNADMGAAFREDATDEEIAAAARPLLRAYIVREGEVVCCAEGMTRGECGNLGRPKTPKRVPQRCSLRVGVFNGGVDWDDKSEPINLPLGYMRGTYKAELARRARIRQLGKGNVTAPRALALSASRCCCAGRRLCRSESAIISCRRSPPVSPARPPMTR